MTSLEDQLRMELDQIAGATHIPGFPSGDPSRRLARLGRGRRVGTIVVTGAAVLAVAVPAAAATGVLGDLGKAFGWTESGPYHVNGSSTQLLALPDAGKDIRVLGAPSAEGTCYSVVDTARPTAQPLVSTCVSNLPTTLSELASAGDANGYYALLTAPGATWISVSGASGTRSVPVAGGTTAVRLNKAEVGVPVKVTSYNAAGQQLEQISLLDSAGVDSLPGAPAGSTGHRSP